MARYRITCIGESESSGAHRHAVSVGIGKRANGIGTKWTVGAVLDALDMGHRFYARPDAGGEREIETFECACGTRAIRLAGQVEVEADSAPLPRCEWAAQPPGNAATPVATCVPR